METKVVYQYGHNDRFDYFIVDSDEEIIEEVLDNDALANIFNSIGKMKLFKNSKIPTGNFELVLKITDKDENFVGLTLANRNEIK